MEPATYIDHLRADGTALLLAARSAPTSPVPTCPEWTITDLVGHVGTTHRWVEEMVRTSATEMGLFPKKPKSWEELATWYEEGLAELVSALGAIDPDEPVWNWVDMGPGPAGFWHRRIAHETSVHRWDAENAVGDAQPIGTALALDGIDEALDMLAMRLTMMPEPSLHGALGLVTTDVTFTCTVELTPDRAERRAGVDKADAVVRAEASDLQLWLVGRRIIGDSKIAVDGDGSVAATIGKIKFG